MSNGVDGGARPDAAQCEALSALVDGELDAESVAGSCATWRGHASARSTWHAYQLIGDVLRSEDLATPAGHDASFLASLRERLVLEPVVLAPAQAAIQVPTDALQGASFAAARQRQRRWSWMAPSAVAAGFVAVAGVLVVTRGPSPAPQPVSLASAPETLPVVAAASQSRTEPRPIVSGGPGYAGGGDTYIRDARLQNYLAAHKQFAGSSVLGVPSGFLRNAAAEVPSR